MNFLEQLEILLKTNNITRTKLAREIGITEASIRSWYNGTSPSLDKLEKISKYFSISISHLVGEKNESLSLNDTELLKYFHQLPEREQIKWIGRIEDASKEIHNNTGKSLDSKIG